MKNPIELSWLQYELKVVPIEASEAQRLDMKNTFFAGATIVYLMVLKIAADNKSENEVVKLIEIISQELLEFSRKVTEGLV